MNRRYSEFESFRECIVRLHPTCIIPFLPEKMPVTMLTLSISKNAETSEVIAKRRKGLETFLNRLASHPTIAEDRLFQRFVEAETWGEILVEENGSSARSGTRPAAAAAASAFLSSVPILAPKVQKPDSQFSELSTKTHLFGQHASAVERAGRRLTRRETGTPSPAPFPLSFPLDQYPLPATDAAADFADLGACFNQFSLIEKELAPSLEKLGAAFDNHYLAVRFLVSKTEDEFLDPMLENVNCVDSGKSVLMWRDRQQTYAEETMHELSEKKNYLKSLERRPETPGTPEGTFFSMIGLQVNKIFDPNFALPRKDAVAKVQAQITQAGFLFKTFFT